MKKFALIIAALMVTASFSYAQQEVAPPCGYADGIPTKFDQVDFEGRFYVLATHQNEYNFFVVDQTLLGGRFERIYFLNMAYSASKLISITQDIEGDQLWFKAHQKYTEEEIAEVLNDLKTKTENAGSTIPDSEKSTWLIRHDKFKKSTTNE